MDVFHIANGAGKPKSWNHKVSKILALPCASSIALLYTTTLNLLKSTRTFRIITQQKNIPPPKLTWQWNIHRLKMYFLLTVGIFQLVMLVFRGVRGFFPGSMTTMWNLATSRRKTTSVSMTKRDLEVSRDLQIHPEIKIQEVFGCFRACRVIFNWTIPRHPETPKLRRYDWTPKTYQSNTVHLRRYSLGCLGPRISGSNSANFKHVIPTWVECRYNKISKWFDSSEHSKTRWWFHFYPNPLENFDPIWQLPIFFKWGWLKPLPLEIS